MQYEMSLFLQAVLMGAVLLLTYSILNTIRKLLYVSSRKSDWLDILFWLAAAMVIFVRLYQTNDGRPRFFYFLGILLGAAVFACWFRPFFEKLCYHIFHVPVRILKKCINQLLFWNKSCRILVERFWNQYKNSTGKYFKVKRGRKLGKIGEKKQKKGNRV